MRNYSQTDENQLVIFGNDIDWGKPLLKLKQEEYTPKIKLYINMLFYAKFNDLEEKLLYEKDSKEKIKYEIEMGKLGVNSILKYINFLGNEAIIPENRKIIKRMIRAEIMLKLWNDSIDIVDIKNFMLNLNEKSSRNIITEKEYIFTYQISNDYSLNTKIIQPEFEAEDIIYLFFKYNENNKFSAGSIFDNIDIHGVDMDNLFKETLNNIKNIHNICDITVICSQILYKEFMKKYQLVLENDYNKLLNYFEDEYKMLDQTIEKKELEAIINGMKLAKFIQLIIESNDNTFDKKITFDDIAIFNNEDGKKIEIESLLINKEINPSFKYFIIKNIQLIKELINSKLKSEYISELFKTNVNYIPFWVFLIRNMSSINCINYENKNNSFSNELTIEIRKKIQNLIIEKTHKVDNSWLNLILCDVPKVILDPDIRLIYYYFNDLFTKLNANGILKKIIERIINTSFLELFNNALDGNINEILNQNIQNNSSEILQLLYSPKKFIKEKIYKEYSEKTKNLMVKNHYNYLEEEIDILIQEIPEKIKKIENNLNQFEDDYKIMETEKKLDEIKCFIEEYNRAFDDLKNQEENIDKKYIYNLEKIKKDINKYQKLYSTDNYENSIIIYKIPIHVHKNIIIKYENKVLTINNLKELYFKIDEIKDEFKNRFIVEKNNGKKGKENKKVEEFIYFEKAEKKIENKIKIDLADDQLISKIKEDYSKEINLSRIIYTRKNFEYFYSDIEEIIKNLINMKDIISKMSNGEFEKIDIKKIKYRYELSLKKIDKFFNDLNKEYREQIGIEFFDIINVIIKKLESILLNVQKNFESLSIDFNNKIGDIRYNLSKNLENIYLKNFNITQLSKINI